MGDSSPLTLTERSVNNVARFLQTVVVVDDKARFEPQPASSSSAVKPETGESDENVPVGIHANLVQPQAETAGLSEDPENLNARTLVNEFAGEGIACAVLVPVPEDEIDTQVTKVAELADIVILDWILDEDNGARATNLIQRILDGENGLNRLRLIAIYTGERDLRAVADKAAQALSIRYGEEPDRPSDFVALKNPVRLVVFGKQYTQVPKEDTELSGRIIEPSALPKRLIREFAEMTTGLMSNVAIAGLTEVRFQTHKLLNNFSRALDPAYLGHRLLLANPSEAEEQVVAMLVAEIFSILEEGDVEKQAAIDSVLAWIKEMEANGSLRLEHLSLTSQDALGRLLEEGIDNVKEAKLGGWKWERVTHAFTSKDCRADRSNRQFARMMHVKTRYGGRPPSLTLGTILFSTEEKGGTYWISLQPKCDSVRIEETRAFPFIPLMPMKDQRCDFEIVVSHRGSWPLLRVPNKPSEMRMFRFDPTDKTKGQVTATWSGSSWNITSVECHSFEWVAELNDEHSQRIADEFASSFSRVGVNELEWVRRSGKKR